MDGLRLWERTRYLFAFFVLGFRLSCTIICNKRKRRDGKRREREREGKRREGIAWHGQEGFCTIRTDIFHFISFIPSFLFLAGIGIGIRGRAAKSESERIFEMYEYLVTVSNCLNK